MPVAHPDFPISEPGRKLKRGWIQLKQGQESRSWPGKLVLREKRKQGRVGGRAEGLGELWEISVMPPSSAATSPRQGLGRNPRGSPRDPCWDPSKGTELQELLQKRRIFSFTL